MADYSAIGFSFSGNEHLRKTSEKWSYTPEEQIEIGKCMADHEYFMRNYVHILNLDSESLVLFEPRIYQLDLAKKMLEDRYTIAKWARQSGKTTIVAASLLWMALFNKNYRILIVAHMHDKAKEILEAVKQMYELLPPFLQHGIKSWGKKAIKMGNGAYISTAGTSGSSGRGGTYHWLYLDEFAHVPSHIAEDFFKSVVPTISSGKTTKITITSTPKGLNFFHTMWMRSVEGQNEYLRSEINWWDVPGRDEAWKKKIIDAYGEDYFRQEFNSEFIGSSSTLISAGKLTQLVWMRPLIHNDNVDVYSEPQRGRIYAICVDISEGIGQDYSVAMCFDITELPYQVACVYRTNITTSMQMPSIIYNMGKTYNEAMVLIESESEGAQVANILHYDLEYPSVISTTTTAKKGQNISGGFGGNSRFGMKMSKQVKSIGCSTLKTLIENDRLKINDHTLLQELYRFTAKGKSFEASEGHDDHVMCCVGFGWLVDQGYIRDINNIDLRKDIMVSYQKELEDRAAPLLIHADMSEGMQEEAALLGSRGNHMFPGNDPTIDPDIQEYLDRFDGRKGGWG
jgi:hypothetical protein